MNITSSVLEDVRRRHDRVSLVGTDFERLPFYYTMANIHGLVNQTWNSSHAQWDDYRPSTQEHIQVARDILEAARVEYEQSQHQKGTSLDPPLYAFPIT